ncbi:MAG TPA: shikimate kinase [Parasegetibacter sp.]
MRIFLIGFMGAGKTYRGKQIAKYFNLPFFDLDQEIAEREGREIPAIFLEEGEEYFRLKEKEILEEITNRFGEFDSGFVLSCGGGTPCFFNNIEFMKKHGKVIWLDLPTEVILERLLKEKQSRPLIRDINDEELKLYITRKLHERKMYYEKADITISEPEFSVDQLSEIIDYV